MNLHNIIFLISACILSITGCGQLQSSAILPGPERIAQRESLAQPMPQSSSSTGETGEFYTAQIVRQMDFDNFCTSVFQTELSEANLLDLHYTLLDPKQYGITPSKASLGTYSLEDMICELREVCELQEQLNSFDRDSLTEEQRLTYDALEATLEASLLGEGLELYEQPLAPTIGIQAQLPILLAEYTFRTEQDIEDYLAILSDINRYYEEIIEFEQQKADAGLGPSDTTIDAIIASCESYLIDPDSNFLTDTFKSRMSEIQTDKHDAYLNLHQDVIRNHFIPAYEALIEGMKTLKGRGINPDGLVYFKQGRDYYEYLLKSEAGLSYTVSELKQALNNCMKRDCEALEELLLRNPNLEADVLNSAFSLTDPVLILEDLKQQMAEDFPALSDCSYEICFVPDLLEDVLSPAFYLTAPLDDINHNIIYINNGSSDASEGLYTTLAHEGFPGHLYQTVYSRQHTDTPLRALLGCSGANEGWATYVERYACTLDNGLSEAVGEYRALVRSFSLCVHGMLDIGINYDGWTKEQAAEYLSACFQVDDETIEILWQTMIDNPTNYLEYCGGYLEIMEMREEAEYTLGEHFSLLEFHRFLLDTGPLPFSVIRDHFKDWLSQTKSTSESISAGISLRSAFALKTIFYYNLCF